ncbi:15272_t:CDS:1 [Cetraspora pellucida]|uniref:15272_t:CDS:1 n=1 Tax=Cetraspora pellucida TaxID=1433469 RepID=A0ACA9K6Q2_9GLOM|nr:15272_t:CDS:1 [Cetraspora pellucida]
MQKDNDKQLFEDGKKYDLLIQNLEQEYLKPPHETEKLQTMRKQLHSEKKFTKYRKIITNFNEALESLLDEERKYKNKIENTFDLEQLTKNRTLDVEIELSDLSKTRKDELQQIRTEQEKI